MSPTIEIALISGGLVLLTAMATQIVQFWLQKSRDFTSKTIEIRSKVYGQLTSKLQLFCHLMHEYHQNEKEAVQRVKSEKQLSGRDTDVMITFFGPRLNNEAKLEMLKDLETYLGECLLFAGPELKELLEALEDELYSSVMHKDWDDPLWDEPTPTDEKAVRILTEKQTEKFFAQLNVLVEKSLELRKLRKKIILSMRHELKIS